MGITLEEMRVKDKEIKRLLHDLEVLEGERENLWEAASLALDDRNPQALLYRCEDLIDLEEKAWFIKNSLRKLGVKEGE